MKNFKDFCETHHYWTGFLTGILLGSFFAVPIVAIAFSLNKSPETKVTPKYKECKTVILYSTNSDNLHYLLDCSVRNNSVKPEVLEDDGEDKDLEEVIKYVMEYYEPQRTSKTKTPKP